MNTDRETILMGIDADSCGSLIKPEPGNGCKYMPVKGWDSNEDSLSFEVDCQKAGEYFASCLLKAPSAVLRIVSGDTVLERTLAAGWDRIGFGLLPLKSGRNRIRIESPSIGAPIEFYSLELIAPDILESRKASANALRSDTSWMRRAGYGIQVHWTTLSCPRTGKRKSYERAAEEFDTEAFADMAKDAGAGYVIFTTSHAEHYIPAPIRAVDRILPGRTTGRDLIADLIRSLNARDIKLMLYYHIGHDDFDDPNGWWAHTGYCESPDRFLAGWRSIIEEIGLRYGSGLAGWFFDDGCAYYPLNPDFYELSKCAKAGNSNRVICYNPWIFPSMTDYQDYFCGEGYDFLLQREYLSEGGDGIFPEGPQKGLQAHTNFILEDNWWHGKEDAPISAPHIPLGKFITDMNEAVRYKIVPSVNLEIYQDGTVSQESIRYLREFRRQLQLT